MSDALSEQKELTMKKVRSLSVGNELSALGSSAVDPGVVSDTDIKVGNDREIESTGRRALYGTLPFFSTFGMSSRELGLRDVISKASSDALSAISTVSKAKKVHSVKICCIRINNNNVD